MSNASLSQSLPRPPRRETPPMQQRTPRSGWAEEKIARILAYADIRIDGDRPWDIRVHDPRFFRRVLLHGSLGLGESYMDGWWDVEALDDFFTRIQRAD